MSYIFNENKWGEKFIEELNRSDFNDTRSTDFFESNLDFDLTSENTLYIVVGSDSGLLLPYLSKQVLGRGSRMVVVEHDDIYPLIHTEYRGLLNKENESANHSLSLHPYSTWRDEVFDGSDKAWLLGGQFKLVESNASAVDYSRLYTPIHRSIKVAMEERINDVSVTLNRQIFTQMQFRNAVDSFTPLKISTTFGQGKTAVVLGGGPSLDLHIEWVMQNRDKLFILAVSRNTSQLIKADLTPDMVVSVDPFDISYEVSKQGVLWPDMPLAYNYHVSAKLLQQWQGPTFYLGKRLPWHSDKETAGYVASAGPTVGHTAVFVASQLGFSTIVMTGIDFCFTRAASTHASESPEQMIQSMPSLCDAQVETYSKRLAGTSLQLKRGLEALDDLGKLVNRHTPTLFNLSAEAARCPSIPYIDCSEIALPEEKPIFSNYMDTTVRAVSNAEISDLEKELKQARHTFSKMRKLCATASDCVVRMHAPDANSEASKISSRLTRIRKQIDKDFSVYLDAIMYDNGVEFSKTNCPTDFKEMTPEELTQWGCHYYELISKGAKAMMKHIDSSYPRLQLRRDELNDTVEVRTLMKGWKEDDTPGRLLRWKRQHWSRVAPKDRAWVQRSIGKFRATLNEPTAFVSKTLSGYNEQLDSVMKSLTFLAEYKKREELTAIESSLDSPQWPYNALKPFVAGLICQIDNELNTAVKDFEKTVVICSDRLSDIPDSLPPMLRLLEEALVRMTNSFIKLNDQQSALTTLGMLCEMLPSYVVSYAKMLNICGQSDFAIELLESYITLYPGHKKAQLLLKNINPEAALLTDDVSPEYVDKINNVVEAIMGSAPERAA